MNVIWTNELTYGALLNKYFRLIDDSYKELLEKMEGSQVATMATVIMINPLDRGFPQLAIHIKYLQFTFCFSYIYLFIQYYYFFTSKLENR